MTETIAVFFLNNVNLLSYVHSQLNDHMKYPVVSHYTSSTIQAELL